MGIKSNNKAESYFNFFGSSSPGGGAGGGSGGPPLSVTGGNTSYTYNDKKGCHRLRITLTLILYM